MSMFEVISDGRYERLKDLRVMDLAEETQGASPHVFIRVSQVIANRITIQ